MSHAAPPPTDLPGTDTAVPAWERRFTAVRMSLPDWAQDAPDRALYVSNAGGTFEVYTWDRSTGTHRQVTDRPNGTHTAVLDPSGEHIWWFADTDGDEYGVWMRQPFTGGPDEPAAPGLEPSYPAGLALARGGLAAVGRSDDTGSTISVARPDAEPVLVYSSAHDASVGDVSDDGTLLALTHAEHGDSRHPALRVIRTADGETIADLSDGPGKGLDVLGFAPRPGDTRLLIGHERHGRSDLALWDLATDEVAELSLDLPGEISAEWFPDASALLVSHEHAARSDLHRYDLATGKLQPVPTPPGVVSEATPRPDGTVEFAWSSSAEPEVIRSSTGAVVLTPPGSPPPTSVPVEDLWVPVSAGRIHALLSRPPAPAPHPTVFLVHGGPEWHDSDAFTAGVAAWVDHGFAVVRVNYRGSTGYGSAWRDAIEARVGHVELEDIAAVREQLVADGVVDPARTVLAGGSWGGFLTLLGLGTQPDLWSVGIAAVPVADYVAAFEDEMEGLKEFDRSLFGGSPDEVPDKYEFSSPITYVEHVRTPVLVLAGANDPRCPIRQIDNYLARLDELEAAHEVYRFDAGHGSLVVQERIRQMRVEIDFALRHTSPARG